MRFLVNFENRAADDEWQRPFFVKCLRTAGRNDSNDTPLERYRRGASFPYVLFSLIRYGLRAVLNLVNREILFFRIFCNFRTVFAPIFEPFVKTRRVIRHWKATNEAQLSYVEIFLRILTVFS